MVLNAVRSIEEKQHDYHYRNLVYARLYSNRDLMSIDWVLREYAQTSLEPLIPTKENTLKSVLDTEVAALSKMHVKAKPITKTRAFGTRKAARQLDKYLYATQKELKLRLKTATLARDAGVWGTGFWKWFYDAKKRRPACERVLPDEIVVDERQCMAGMNPQELYQRKLVSRQTIKAMLTKLGKQKEVAALEKCQRGADWTWTTDREAPRDEIICVEAWRLPSYEGAGDGRHCMVVDGISLFDESWTEDFFPFTVFRIDDPLSGYYGIPAVEEIAPYQWRLDKLNDLIDRAHLSVCIPRMFVQAGTQLSVEKIRDTDAFDVIRVRGQLPEVPTFSAFPPEVYQERERLANKGYRQRGISEMSSQAALPGGVRLDSSKAINSFSMMEDQRGVVAAAKLEECYLDAYQKIIWLSNKHKGDMGKPTWRNRHRAEAIDWGTVDLAIDDYTMTIEPESARLMSPAERYEEIDRQLSRGWISQDQAAYLYDNPDLESETALTTAQFTVIDSDIEDIEEGKFAEPDPLSNLTLAMTRATQAYNEVRKLDEVPDEVLEGYRRYIETCQALLADASAAMQQPSVDQAQQAAMAPPLTPGM